MAKYESGGASFYEGNHCNCWAFRRAMSDSLWDPKVRRPTRDSKYKSTDRGLEKWWYCDKCGKSSEKVIARRLPGEVNSSARVTLHSPTGLRRSVIACSEVRDKLMDRGWWPIDDDTAPLWDGIEAIW